LLQPRNRQPHRQTRGLQDIDPVDRRRIHLGYCPRQSNLAHDKIQPDPLLLAQLL